MTTMVTRAGWGAEPPNGEYTYLAKTLGVKVHYTGGYINPKIVQDHRICLQVMADIQKMHMSGGRGEVYMDFGYNLGACPHRRVIMGRGAHRLPAANGAGLNTSHYAILALIGSSGFVKPTDDLLHAVRDGIEWLRQKGAAGNQIKGHLDGYNTSCPGQPMYDWIKKGAPRPDAAGATPKPAEKPIKVELDDNGFAIWPGRVLELEDPMMHGEDVEALQARWAKRGWDIDVDGWYGEQSRGVCRSWQRAVDLPDTGRVDKATWESVWSWTKPPAEPAQP